MPGRHIEEGGISGPIIGAEFPRKTVDRRAWLRIAAGGVVGLSGFERSSAPAKAGDDTKSVVPDEAGQEIGRAEAKAKTVTSRPLLRLDSAHYQAIGDASEVFIRLTLSDCEQIARDYLSHFRAKGFDVKMPDRRLSVIAFVDERPFLKFAEKTPPGTIGFYSRSENWLVLFDFRNVPMNPNAPGQSNMETVTHEATHQLTFNTGLLDKQTDIPLCVVEGLAMYGEHRRLTGRSEPGQLNLRRLDELAHTQRRTSWISLTDLLADDRSWYARDSDHRALGYAESWLLVYHLMTDGARLPQFRDYLKSLRGRRDRTHRLEDARAHFGDLIQLDRELRQVSIRLQRLR